MMACGRQAIKKCIGSPIRSELLPVPEIAYERSETPSGVR